MSKEDFEEEARRRGFDRRERPRVDNKNDSAKKDSSGCFDSCFGRGGVRRKEAHRSSLETVREDTGDSAFSFHPQTQPQVGEASYLSTPIEGSPPPYITTPLETPIETPLETPMETPLETPLETPSQTPRSVQVQSIYDTHRNLYYTVDEYGEVRADNRGKRVITRMHELMSVYFPDDIFTDWRRQPEDSKNIVIAHLHDQFPNPEGMRFNESLMKTRMGHVLKTRRATTRLAAAAKDYKPSFLSSNDWQKVKDELRAFPNRWEQQREANKVQRETTGISRLGSGGRATFLAEFEYMFGRPPTTKEYEEARDNAPRTLYKRLEQEGKRPRQKPKTKRFINLTYAAGPNGEIQSDGDEEEDDVSYAPASDTGDTEDEELESEGEEAEVWLKDVDVPTSSTRRSRHR